MENSTIVLIAFTTKLIHMKAMKSNHNQYDYAASQYQTVTNGISAVINGIMEPQFIKSAFT